MTSPAPPGGSSPLRIGGFALLAVGAVAGLIGVASLVGGGGDTNTAAPTDVAPTSVLAAPAPTAPGSGPEPAAPVSPGPGVAVPSFGPTPSKAIAAPPTTAAPPAVAGTGGGGGAGSGASAGSGGGGGGARVAKLPLRVYNNSTISGLATRAADDFRAQGWTVDTVANYSQGVIPASTVYYRPGTNEEASARVMASTFGVRAEPRFTGLDEATPGLIVIVTNNYRSR